MLQLCTYPPSCSSPCPPTRSTPRACHSAYVAQTDYFYVTAVAVSAALIVSNICACCLARNLAQAVGFVSYGMLLYFGVETAMAEAQLSFQRGEVSARLPAAYTHWRQTDSAPTMSVNPMRKARPIAALASITAAHADRHCVGAVSGVLPGPLRSPHPHGPRPAHPHWPPMPPPPRRRTSCSR